MSNNINITPGLTVPHESKNALERAYLNLEGESFNSLLFASDAQLDNKTLSLSKDPHNKISLAVDEQNAVPETHFLPYVLNNREKEGVIYSDIENRLSDIFSFNKSDVVVMRSDREERKELHEQKLFANYSLSYIDINNLPNAPRLAKANDGELKLVVSKETTDLFAGNHLNSSLKLFSGPLAIRPALSNSGTIYNDDAVASAALVSQRYMHNESIEKSKVVISRQEKSASLYVRDHFSDKKTLAAVVTDILGRLKSTINEVIINGKRG